MSSSLPVPTAPSASRKDVIVNTLAGFTLRAMPRIPTAVKRALVGWRSVTVDGNTLDTTMQLMLAGQRLAGIDGLMAGADVGAARARLEILAAAFKQELPVAAVSTFSLPGPAGQIRARHYRPIDGDGRPLLVYYHGGGHVIGSLDTHDDLCRHLCREGEMHVLSVDYRLAPEHKAPAGADDAFAAFTWALDHAADLGANPDRVAVGGDSAGGNLAAVTSLRARDEGARLPALQVLLYPMTNVRDATRSQTLFGSGFFLTKADLATFKANHLDGADVDASDPRVSPLLAGDLSGLPPALVVTAGFDPLRDEGRQYADAMRDAGAAVDHREFGSLVHAFASFFALGGDSATATTASISAMRAHLARS